MKRFILPLAALALVAIPATYLVGRSGGHGGSVHSFASGRTGSTSTARNPRTFTSSRTIRTSTKPSSTRMITKRGRRGGDRRRSGRHGNFWGHRRGFRGYPGNFWLSGIGYPWWWYDTTYQHVCVDRFGFEVDPAFCYANPGRFFWWYR